MKAPFRILVIAMILANASATYAQKSLRTISKTSYEYAKSMRQRNVGFIRIPQGAKSQIPQVTTTPILRLNVAVDTSLLHFRTAPKIKMNSLLLPNGKLIKEQKDSTIERYKNVCKDYNDPHINTSERLLIIGQHAAKFGLDSISDDCFRKYTDRYSHTPTIIYESINAYEKAMASRPLEMRCIVRYMPEILDNAIVGAANDIYTYTIDATDSLTKSRIFKECMGLKFIANRYAPNKAPFMAALSKIMIPASDSTNCKAMIDAAQLFLHNKGMNGGDAEHCLFYISSALLMHSYNDFACRKMILDFHDDATMTEYIKGNIYWIFILYRTALENADERVGKYHAMGHSLDGNIFDEEFKKYHTAIYRYVLENPGETELLEYLWGISGSNIHFCADFFDNCMDYLYENYPRRDSLYVDEEQTAYRDAIIGIIEKNSSVTAQQDSSEVLISEFLTAATNKCYKSSAAKGRAQMKNLYDRLWEKGEKAEYSAILVAVCINHAGSLQYGEGKKKEAYKILKSTLSYIKDRQHAVDDIAKIALEEIITSCNELGKKKTAQKAKELLDRLFPEV